MGKEHEARADIFNILARLRLFQIFLQDSENPVDLRRRNGYAYRSIQCNQSGILKQKTYTD